jgi:hypothetical protein
MAIAEHHPEEVNPENRGVLKMSHRQLHDFASTPEKGLPEYAADGETPTKWMQGAVKRPGALTAKAHAAGESPMTFAHEHYHSPGLIGQEARFAVNAQKHATEGYLPPRPHAPLPPKPTRMRRFYGQR